MITDWNALTADQQALLLRQIKAEELKALFGLTDDDLRAALVAAKTVYVEDASAAGLEAYDGFLKADYDNLATAHFNTDATITKFFQFYLLIAGLPISVFGILFQTLAKPGPQSTSATTGASTPSAPVIDMSALLTAPYGWLLFSLAMAITLLGLFMLAYIINLRLDALQYARAINGIRKHFIERADIDLAKELGMRVLPRSIHQPRYREWRFFGFVVAAFAALDSLYVAAALLLLPGLVSWQVQWWHWLGFAITVAGWSGVHFALYAWLTRYRDLYYLRTYIIGVDVDGVLNDHRRHFCEILEKETGIQLDPESITRIPVHECNDLKDTGGNSISISRDQEQLVFNRVEYWSEMRVADNAERILREFKETLHYKVKIFTYRPWPNPDAYFGACAAAGWLAETEEQKKKEFVAHWGREARLAGSKPVEPSFLGERWNALLRRRRIAAIRHLTNKWLNKHGLLRDSLTVEHGNVYVADPRTRTRNRFTVARAKEVRIFIEDDLAKARKLSSICEFVYLIEHPYNSTANLPRNVIRVKNLTEVMQHVRDYL